jgi:hypothetical protein
VVAGEHLHIRQHVVAEAHGLGDLQVGEARHHDVHVLLRQPEQRLLQHGEQVRDQVDLAAQPQAHVGGDLVIPAAAGVQPLAGVPHHLREARFDVQVHVLEIELPLEGAGLDLGQDLRHAAADVRQVAGGDHALALEHRGVRQGARDVRLRQPLVEEDAGGIALHQVAHGLAEEGGPGLGFLIELAHRG